MDNKYTVLIAVATLIATFFGTQYYEDLKSGTYVQCRVGSTYGTWIPTETEYIYTCDITEVDQICWKTTKTRCYLLDLSKVETLAVELEPEVSKEIPKTEQSSERIHCTNKGCI